MLGPDKAKLLASCVEKATSGCRMWYCYWIFWLWILRVLKALATGHLITVFYAELPTRRH